MTGRNNYVVNGYFYKLASKNFCRNFLVLNPGSQKEKKFFHPWFNTRCSASERVVRLIHGKLGQIDMQF